MSRLMLPGSFYSNYIKTVSKRVLFYSTSKSKELRKENLATAYIPKNVENNKHNWEQYSFESKCTNSSIFSIVLPPPNITGSLHLGHALTVAIEDSLARWHRMQGASVKWIPGMDHAGIATQVIVEKKIWHEQQKTRHDIGRDSFLEHVWKWQTTKSDVIRQQLQRLGASVDWSEEVFTMDKQQSAAVVEAFLKLFEANLIYRADSLVNWSCVLQSAISDIEVEQVKIDGPTYMSIPGYEKPVLFGKLFEFAYKLTNSDEEIVVATTRPETMLGDVAVAVHPLDDRYSHLIGKSVWHPFRKISIPIISDDFVDRGFGTGAVKITPAHDHDDFDVAKRHNLEIVHVLNANGNLNDGCELFAGLQRFHARQAVIESLTSLNLFRGTRDHQMIIPLCSRSRDVIELLLKPQWFINCKSMSKRALAAIETGELEIDPPAFKDVWCNWLENIRDWCVSRQLWWGHRVPAYKCSLIGDSSDVKWIVARNEKSALEKAQLQFNAPIENIVCVQDEDVLDTWFSSGVFPFSVMGWPKQSEKLSKYYPLSLIETGHDILFFWVARMVMLGLQLTDRLPFKKILLHGILCDARGRKMSKSLGNVISPENVIDGISLKDLHLQSEDALKSGLLSNLEYERAVEGQKLMFPNGIPACGADALRFTLCSHNVKSHFINFDVTECNVNRLFCNKIWQATRYFLMCADRWNFNHENFTAEQMKRSLIDDWILSRLAHTVDTVDGAFRNYELHVATSALKTFFYGEFCDIYLECTKKLLQHKVDSQEHRDTALGCCSTLFQSLEVGLRLLAPFMPFVTYDLHKQLHFSQTESIKDTAFPSPIDFEQYRNKDLEKDFDAVIETVTCIRRLKNACSVNVNKGIQSVVVSSLDCHQKFLNEIVHLSRCETKILTEPPKDYKVLMSDTIQNHTIVHLCSQAQNVQLKTVSKFDKKETKIVQQLEKLLSMTSTEAYKTKASLEVQKSHQEKIAQLKEELRKINELQRLV